MFSEPRKTSFIFSITLFWLIFSFSMMWSSTTFAASLVQVINTSQFSPPSPDSAGIAYLSSSDTLLFSDSEVNEMPIFTGVNLFEMTLSGNLIDTFTTVSFSDEPTGVAYNPANEHIFISDDDDRQIYEVDPGPDGFYDTSDDIISSFDTSAFSSMDPEGLAYDSWQGVLFIADGLNNEIYRVSPGSNCIFDGLPPDGDDQVSSFDTEVLGIYDPEGITFDTDNGHLYLVGKPNDLLAHVTTEGTLVRMLDISVANASNLAGLAYAPSSVNPSQRNIYITERGVDNNSDPDENDGRVYEISFPHNVASFHTYDGQHYVALACSDPIAYAAAVDNPSPADSPSGVEFPYGFFEFTINGLNPGDAVTVILYLPDEANPTTYYRYGPTPSDGTYHWYEFLYNGQTGAEINGNAITLHFVDGNKGDDDLTADGTVIDVGGPGVSLNTGGGGGCFIATAAYGSQMFQ